MFAPVGPRQAWGSLAQHYEAGSQIAAASYQCLNKQRKTERKTGRRWGESKNIIPPSKQGVTRPRKQHLVQEITQYRRNTWPGRCFTDKQSPRLINKAAAGKRDEPNEFSIKQKHTRLPLPSCIHSPNPLYFFFLSISFLLAWVSVLSLGRLGVWGGAGTACSWQTERNKTQAKVRKKKKRSEWRLLFPLAGTFCPSHLLDLPHRLSDALCVQADVPPSASEMRGGSLLPSAKNIYLSVCLHLQTR